jgi:hypothetical protein
MPIAAVDNRSDFYVYAWLKPCGNPFYIGKGCGKRDEKLKDYNPIFSRILAKIKSGGDEPVIVRLHENLTEGAAFDLERAEISKWGRKNNATGILANLTDGGEGTSGLIHSSETRAKMSANRSGKGIGLEPSEETRRKLRASSALRDASYRQKLSAATIGIPKSQEHRSKMRAYHGDRPSEHQNKITLANRMLPSRDGFKGVTYTKTRNRWRARIRTDDACTFLGYFALPEEAAKAYDRAAIVAWGVGGCYTNFPIAA